MAYATSWRACFLNKARVCVYLDLTVLSQFVIQCDVVCLCYSCNRERKLLTVLQPSQVAEHDDNSISRHLIIIHLCFFFLELGYR